MEENTGKTPWTPGPWRWTDGYLTDDDRRTWTLLGGNGAVYGILSCDGEENSPQGIAEQGAANAHLIAAAPMLAEVLEEISSQSAGGFFAKDINEFAWMLKRCGELADAALRLARPETAPEGEGGE